MKRHYFQRCIVAVFAVLFAFPPSVASAVDKSYDQEYFLRNGGFHYSPDSPDSCTGASTVAGNTNVEKIWNYLVGKGLSAEQAAGIMGNIQEEGGFSVTRQETSQSFPNGGWGLVQWTGSRRLALVAAILKSDSSLMKYYNAKYGGSVSSKDGYVAEGLPVADSDKILAIELDFLYQESSTRIVRDGWGVSGKSEWDSIKAAKTLSEASDIWLYSFERPARQDTAQSNARIENGSQILKQLAGVSGVPSSESCAGVDTSGTQAALLALVKKYAHPTYGKNNSTPTPEYAKAVTDAKQNGIYVGNNGIDCGGFVTLLMINSGFEPNYNYNGKISQGAGITDTQEKWAKEHWQTLGRGSSIDTGTLRPGDVAFQPGHTFVYIGSGTISGWDSKYVVASASNGVRAPMAGLESISDANVTWYRKK